MEDVDICTYRRIESVNFFCVFFILSTWFLIWMIQFHVIELIIIFFLWPVFLDAFPMSPNG